jgi:hypothetical protein
MPSAISKAEKRGGDFKKAVYGWQSIDDRDSA